MRLAGLTLALAFPALLRSQAVTIQEPGQHESAAILREALARPHVFRTGSGRLDLPRDSIVTSSIIVIGRPAYVASTVHGDVIVVGSDLFLHPGADISGRAVAIGGTVARSSLGHVAGDVLSFRDETYDARSNASGVSLAYRSLRAETEAAPIFGLAGLQGLLAPSYDRVDGLSLPVGALVTLSGIELQPSVTYRSRLGALDPRVDVRTGADSGIRFEGFAGMLTRTNERWIYTDLVNSALVFLGGLDAHNYFRSRDAEGRIFYRATSAGRSIEPFFGARIERTSPITAAGNVWSVRGRRDIERVARPNPLVETGNIGSLLAGGQLFDTSGVVTTKLRAELEQSVATMSGTSSFTQVTLDLRVGFPTFGTQSLQLRGHGVGTAGNAVPRSRYAYLGGSGSLPVTELLEFGGTELLFLETRYLVPIDRLVLPMIGSPVLTFRHLLGAAGVGNLPRLEQAVGVGIGLSALRLDVTTDATRRGHTKLGGGISFGH